MHNAYCIIIQLLSRVLTVISHQVKRQTRIKNDMMDFYGPLVSTSFILLSFSIILRLYYSKRQMNAGQLKIPLGLKSRSSPELFLSF